jgi:hypothetical protein
MNRVLRTMLGLMMGFLLSGCSDNHLIKPKGRIVKGGAPFQAGEGENFRIILAPADPPQGSSYDSYPAEYHREDGTFQVVGKDGKGLPPGKYRVGLELIKKKEDLYKGAFMGGRSPFTCEVTGGSSEIVVDLDQGGR